jgi:hypothetical protein
MTDEEIWNLARKWEELVDKDIDNVDDYVYDYIGLSEAEFDAWHDNHEPFIEIGVDVDTVEPQRIHVVLGVGHFDKQPLCGAKTLWGYYNGTRKNVTCPQCLKALQG